MFQIEVRSVGSAGGLRNQRSMIEFMRGARAALQITVVPASARTWSKAVGSEAHVKGTRARLKRLVNLGSLDKTEPGLFHHPRPKEPTASADQRS